MSIAYCEKHGVTIVGGGQCSFCQQEAADRKMDQERTVKDK